MTDTLSGPPADRKPTHWDDLKNVSRGAAQVDGTYPEIVQSLQFQSDGSTTAKTIQSAKIDTSASSTVVAAVTSKRIKVFAIYFSVDTAGTTVVLKDGSTALDGASPYAQYGGYAETVDPPGFLIGTTAGNALNITVTGGNAFGRVSYYADDAT